MHLKDPLSPSSLIPSGYACPAGTSHGPSPAGLGAAPLWKEGQPPVREKLPVWKGPLQFRGLGRIHHGGTWATSGPRQGWTEAGAWVRRGSAPGTPFNTCDDPETEGAPKQQAHLLRLPLVSQWQGWELWVPLCLNPADFYPKMGWGPSLTRLHSQCLLRSSPLTPPSSWSWPPSPPS